MLNAQSRAFCHPGMVGKKEGKRSDDDAELDISLGKTDRWWQITPNKRHVNRRLLPKAQARSPFCRPFEQNWRGIAADNFFEASK
jgi:hypothetical protein